MANPTQSQGLGAIFNDLKNRLNNVVTDVKTNPNKYNIFAQVANGNVRSGIKPLDTRVQRVFNDVKNNPQKYNVFHEFEEGNLGRAVPQIQNKVLPVYKVGKKIATNIKDDAVQATRFAGGAFVQAPVLAATGGKVNIPILKDEEFKAFDTKRPDFNLFDPASETFNKWFVPAANTVTLAKRPATYAVSGTIGVASKALENFLENKNKPENQKKNLLDHWDDGFIEGTRNAWIYAVTNDLTNKLLTRVGAKALTDVGLTEGWQLAGKSVPAVARMTGLQLLRGIAETPVETAGVSLYNTLAKKQNFIKEFEKNFIPTLTGNLLFAGGSSVVRSLPAFKQSISDALEKTLKSTANSVSGDDLTAILKNQSGAIDLNAKIGMPQKDAVKEALDKGIKMPDVPGGINPNEDGEFARKIMERTGRKVILPEDIGMDSKDPEVLNRVLTQNKNSGGVQLEDLLKKMGDGTLTADDAVKMKAFPEVQNGLDNFINGLPEKMQPKIRAQFDTAFQNGDVRGVFSQISKYLPDELQQTAKDATIAADNIKVGMVKDANGSYSSNEEIAPNITKYLQDERGFLDPNADVSNPLKKSGQLPGENNILNGVDNNQPEIAAPKARDPLNLDDPTDEFALNRKGKTLTNKAGDMLPKDVIDASANWNDKSRLSYARETMERNFEDIMGADAPAMKKYYLEPIGENEASRIRWLNTERQSIKDLGIAAGSPESALLQQFGEKKISLEQLKDATPEWQKIVDADTVIRGKYDTYLETINKVLAKNGYDPIPKRDDYYRHFQEVGNAFAWFGIPFKDDALPTDLNGLTMNFKPGKNFFSSQLPRLGDQTDFDAIKGIDTYLDGASKQIYHTDDIQRLRLLEKGLRENYAGTDHLSNFVADLGEYTNNLAGKKAMIDRATESLLGRNVYGITNKLKKQFGANAVGMNVSSALTNYIPLTQAAGTTDKQSLVKGALQTIGSTFEDDGFRDSSDFLTRRVGSDPIAVGFWDKAADKANWLFKTIDRFTSETIVRGKYNELIKQGLSSDEAMAQADDYAARIIADRSLGATPTLFNAKTIGFLTQFQLEVNNQLSFLFKDIPRQHSAVGAASALAQIFLYSYLFNNVFEKVAGRRPAFDPIGIVTNAYQDYKKMGTAKAIEDTTSNVLQTLPFTSIFEGGRIPALGALPDLIGIAKGTTDPRQELEKTFFGLVPPFGGGQARKTIQGLTDVSQGGYIKNGQLKFGVGQDTENILRNAVFGRWSSPEARLVFQDDLKPLSQKETILWQKMVDQGYDSRKAWAAIYKIRLNQGIQARIGSIVTDLQDTPEQKAEKIKLMTQQVNAVSQDLDKIINGDYSQIDQNQLQTPPTEELRTNPTNDEVKTKPISATYRGGKKAKGGSTRKLKVRIARAKAKPVKLKIKYDDKKAKVKYHQPRGLA